MVPLTGTILDGGPLGTTSLIILGLCTVLKKALLKGILNSASLAKLICGALITALRTESRTVVVTNAVPPTIMR